MRLCGQIALVLVIIVTITGCQKSIEQNAHNGEIGCQEDLARLMADQPGFAAPLSCDPGFVCHLEAAR